MRNVDFDKIQKKLENEIDKEMKRRNLGEEHNQEAINQLSEKIRLIALEISMSVVKEYHEELVNKYFGRDF